MKRVLILDGAIWPDIYSPAEHWRRPLGPIPSVAVHLPSGQPVPDLAGFTHLVVTGSEASIVEPEPWFDVEADVVRRAVRAGIPVLGSCFGHQMLALALSGGRHVVRAQKPEIGWLPVGIVAADGLFDGLPNPLWMFASHFDEVADPPAPWRVLARTADCRVHAMRYGSAPVWGIQAHPEIDPQDAVRLMRGFIGKRPDLASDFAAPLASVPRDDGAVREIVRRFIESG